MLVHKPVRNMSRYLIPYLNGSVKEKLMPKSRYSGISIGFWMMRLGRRNDMEIKYQNEENSAPCLGGWAAGFFNSIF